MKVEASAKISINFDSDYSTKNYLMNGLNNANRYAENKVRMGRH